MSDDLKARVGEIVSIVRECPENLQACCFELLLRDYLDQRKRRDGHGESTQPPPAAPGRAVGQEASVVVERPTGPQKLNAGNLHAGARTFMERHAISLDHLNRLFYVDDGDVKPRYDDLKTQRKAARQIRITLLQALRAGITCGEFVADGEAVRAESQLRKAFDRPNFATSFRNNARLFEGFSGYRKGTTLRLSETGKRKLARVIRELAR